MQFHLNGFRAGDPEIPDPADRRKPASSSDQLPDAVDILIRIGHEFFRWPLALKLLEPRLWIKKVDVAWSSLHDQVNHRLRPGLEVSGTGLYIEGVLARFRWRRRAVQVLAEQVGQGSSVGARADTVEEAAPAYRGVLYFVRIEFHGALKPELHSVAAFALAQLQVDHFDRNSRVGRI